MPGEPTAPTEGIGRVVRDDGGVHLEFVRTLAAPVARVWADVTEPERSDQWIGRWTGDPAGGSIDFVMTAEGEDSPQPVLVDECSAPHRLAVTMPGPDGPWPIELTLTERADGTELRFVHHLAEPYDAGSIGPGWQYYLDRLAAVVTGSPVPDDFDAYYPRFAEAYGVPSA